MPDGTTPVLGLVKPEVGASTDTWGGKHNANQDVIDGLFTDPVKKLLAITHGGTGTDSIANLKTSLSLGALAALNTVGTPQINDGSVTAVKLATGVALASGTRALFQQSIAPVGWVKDTANNDKSLRLVNGTVGSGGSVPFSTAFTSTSLSGTVGSATTTGTIGDTALSVAQMPLHGHPTNVAITAQSTPSSNSTGGMMLNTTGDTAQAAYTGSPDATAGHQVGGQGGGATHTHSFTGSAHTHSLSGGTINLAVQYVDVIIAVKS